MDNNTINSNEQDNQNLVTSNDNASLDQPVILESMTVPIDLPITPSSNIDYGNVPEMITQDVGESNSETADNSLQPIDIPIMVPEDANIPESIQVPEMTNSSNNTDNLVTDNIQNDTNENSGSENEPIEEKDINIKVGALSKLSKKKKKEKAKQKDKEALINGKLPTKVLVFPFIIIVILIGVIIYLVLSNNRSIQELRFECSPISSSSTEKKIDINSTIVQDLYNKVKTNIREDIAQPEWNDKMRIYLAYRQITENNKYDSNCNLFDSNKMEPYTCFQSSTFSPLAFTADTLRHEWKMLYGEDTEMPLINVKLENSCIGGYEYIPKRDEYVQGYCEYQAAPLIKVNKKLVEASVIRNTLILKEEVRYIENEKINLPSYLVSGDYYYTFKLDMNYNYVFVSKKYNDKY